MAEVAERPTRRPRERVAEEEEDQQQDDRTDTSATLEPLTEASAQDWLGSNQDPDVMLSVPNIGIDSIQIEVDNLKAHVELHAKVLDLVELHVGAQVSVDVVKIDIENVRVQAMLKVKLDKVAEIVDRVLTTIEEHPEALREVLQGVGEGLSAIEGSGNMEKEDQQEEDQEDQEDKPQRRPSRRSRQ